LESNAGDVTGEGDNGGSKKSGGGEGTLAGAVSQGGSVVE